jgi:hypothetical protein
MGSENEGRQRITAKRSTTHNRAPAAEMGSRIPVVHEERAGKKSSARGFFIVSLKSVEEVA